jgi:hypothetical protein
MIKKRSSGHDILLAKGENNLPFLEKETQESLERFQFAVLKQITSATCFQLPA